MLLLDPLVRPHPLVLNNTLTPVAWGVSEGNCPREEFLKKQPNLLPGQEEKMLWKIMNWPGRSVLAGVNGKLIRSDVPYVMF